MAKFHIGQMVRVVAVSYEENNYLIGSVGIVYGIDCKTHDGSSGCVAVNINGDDDNAFEAFQLEPILYDGAKPIAESFEEMMGKLREGVVA